MEELVDLKLTRSIGVSNFSISQVERICKVAKYKPVTNQVYGNLPLFTHIKNIVLSFILITI